MALSPRVSIALAAAIVAIATAGRARAQTDAPAVVPVEISATQQGAYIQLRGPHGEIPCGERCALQLPHGQYRVFVRDREGYATPVGGAGADRALLSDTGGKRPRPQPTRCNVATCD